MNDLKTFVVYFSIGEKKMKMKVRALNETLAIIKVKESIKIIECKNDIVADFDTILNWFKK